MPESIPDWLKTKRVPGPVPRPMPEYPSKAQVPEYPNWNTEEGRYVGQHPRSHVPMLPSIRVSELSEISVQTSGVQCWPYLFFAVSVDISINISVFKIKGHLFLPSSLFFFFFFFFPYLSASEQKKKKINKKKMKNGKYPKQNANNKVYIIDNWSKRKMLFLGSTEGLGRSTKEWKKLIKNERTALESWIIEECTSNGDKTRKNELNGISRFSQRNEHQWAQQQKEK